MSVLLIDAGNSRVKWVRVENGVWQQQGVLENVQITARLFDGMPPLERILASNVAGEQTAHQLREACAGLMCEIEFIHAQPIQCGVRNTYQQPAQLGSDRWAALIAAWQQEQRACLVVCCGTATTIDALSEQGVFLGGFILPGLAAMRQGLPQSARKLADCSGEVQ